MDVLTASCVVVRILVVDEVVIVGVVVLECTLLWAVVGCLEVCNSLSTEPVVVVVSWVDVTAPKSCFGVILAVEGGFAVLSPKKNGGENTLLDMM